MLLPPIKEVLGDAKLVNQSRSLVFESAVLFNEYKEVTQGSLKKYKLRMTSKEAPIDKIQASAIDPSVETEWLAGVLEDAIKELKNVIQQLDDGLICNQQIHSTIKGLSKRANASESPTTKFKLFEEIISCGEKIFSLRPISLSCLDAAHYCHDSLSIQSKEYKKLRIQYEELSLSFRDLQNDLNKIIDTGRRFVTPPDFLNLNREWTEAFDDREIAAENIISAGCKNLTREILRQEKYLDLELDEETNNVNAISAARALISFVERVFQKSILNYWTSIDGGQEKLKIINFILSQDDSSKEDVEKAFTEENFTLFTAEYFMRLLIELVKVNETFGYSAKAFFNKNYIDWLESNKHWNVLRELRLNLRNPIMHPKKDYVELKEYEKYSTCLIGKERFSNWFNTSVPGTLFFKMQNSHLLQGQLIARGAF